MSFRRYLLLGAIGAGVMRVLLAVLRKPRLREGAMRRGCTFSAVLLLAWSAAASAALFPGPDEFGYVGMEIPAVQRDVRGTGTLVPLGDDQLSDPLPIGFSFEFYGVAYTGFRISSNGFITLGPDLQSDGCCTGGAIPAPFSPNNLIAAWWEDFNAPPGNIRFQTLGTPGNRELVVGFYDVPHFFNGPRATWEIVLHEGTNSIEIHCWSCPSDGGPHSVGIENGDGSIGLQIARTTSSIPRIGWLIGRGEPPDCSEARAEPDRIWPPNEQFVAVPVLGVTDPDGDEVSIRIDGVAQDEPLSVVNDPMSADAWGVGSEQAQVRAERSGRGDGRVYHVHFTASDGLGGACTGAVTICVPHSRKRGCVDQGPLYDSTRPPSLESSDPAPGSAGVPRTAWIRLSGAERLGPGAAIRLSCDGMILDRSVTALDSRTLVVNPDEELPAGALCHVRFLGQRGPEEFLFAVAEGDDAATISYDRSDPTSLAPFPDDFWLVDDPSTPSGKRIQLEAGDLGDPTLNVAVASIAAAIADRDGFSPIQSIVLGLSEGIDPANLPQDEFGSIDPLSPIALYDMDPGSASFGQLVPFTLEVRSDPAPDGTSDHTAILFPAVRLEPGGTYGLVVTRRLVAAGDPGRPFVSSVFFDQVAGPAAPGEDAAAGRARESIEPVLDFLESVPDLPIPREDVALAVRISIRSEAFDPSDLVAIKEATLAAPPPTLEVQSLDEPSFSRAAILRGTVELPVYLDPANPGRLHRDPVSGRPVPSSTEAVPFVLSLPEQSLDGPVPIVLYQHGTPGSPEEILFGFNDFLDDAGYAIGGIQDVLNRRFGEDPQTQTQTQFILLLLFQHFPLFDFQSYADMLGFLRAIQGLGDESWLPLFAPDDVPEIDPSRILFRGISQGSHYSLAFLPLAPEITAAASVVGAGRYFEQAIHQFSTVDFASVLPAARPGDILVGLAALESDMDRQDSHLLARHLYREPLAVLGRTGTTPPSLLWLEGIGDSLVTNNSTRAAAAELGIPLVRPVQHPTPVLEEADAPLSENIAPDVTAGHFQYDPVNTPSCRDLFFQFEGHFCPQIALEAEEQTLHLFETALDPGASPEIIDPFPAMPTLQGLTPEDPARHRFGDKRTSPSQRSQ
jgi:hypothetical protein